MDSQLAIMYYQYYLPRTTGLLAPIDTFKFIRFRRTGGFGLKIRVTCRVGSSPIGKLLTDSVDPSCGVCGGMPVPFEFELGAGVSDILIETFKLLGDEDSESWVILVGKL